MVCTDLAICLRAGSRRDLQKVPRRGGWTLEVLLIENNLSADSKTIEGVIDGFSRLSLRPEIRGAFEKLERANIPIVTLGNGSSHIVRNLLEREGAPSIRQSHDFNR